MVDEKEIPLTIIINILHGDKLMATKVKVMRDELLGLREGAFNMEHNIKELSAKAVREVFDKIEAEKNA